MVENGKLDQFFSLNYAISLEEPTKNISETRTPCEPNPCGSNAICRELNGIGSCQCQPEFFGDPYESCRPECLLNSECDANKVCIQNKCINPCPGTCSANAVCQVTNHIPSCTCLPGFRGDPYRLCQKEPERKKFFMTFIENLRPLFK